VVTMEKLMKFLCFLKVLNRNFKIFLPIKNIRNGRTKITNNCYFKWCIFLGFYARKRILKRGV
jgi:hypothetical protein